jgi:hypothetical protein
MSEKKCAKIFGTVLFLIGLLSCIPGLTADALFLGLFHVNFATNALHLITGVVIYGASRISSRSSQLFFQICGIAYGIIAVLGFGYEDRDVLGYFANNMSDTWLHLAIAFLALYLGFLYKTLKKA